MMNLCREDAGSLWLVQVMCLANDLVCQNPSDWVGMTDDAAGNFKFACVVGVHSYFQFGCKPSQEFSLVEVMEERRDIIVDWVEVVLENKYWAVQ